MRIHAARERRAHGMHCGEESERDARQQSKHEREREQACVEYSLENGTVRREDGEHGADRQVADDERAGSAQYAEQRRLAQQQPNDPVRAGTERQPNGHLCRRES